MTDPRPHLRALAESLPPGIAEPVPREWLLELLGSASTPAADPTDCYLTADQVAARLDLSVQQVYRQAKRWPFAKKLSPKALRFSEAGLNRWLERRGTEFLSVCHHVDDTMEKPTRTVATTRSLN